MAVVGEAGIGKTSLVHDATAAVEALGFRAMRTALSEVESHLSWAGLRLLCRDVTDDELASLPEVLRRAIPAAIGRGNTTEVDATAVAFALAEVLERRAAERPVLLVVDDLHWLDVATAGALAFAIRATATSPVLTLVAHRPVEMSIEPDRLLDGGRTTRIDLPGLSVAGVHAVLRDRAGVAIGRPDVLRIHTATGGHPLHTIEIGRLLASGSTLDEALVHPSAYAVIMKRIEALPFGTRSVLLAAALTTRPTLDRIRRVFPGVDVESELDAAIKQQLADLRGGVIVFSHPLARSAVAAAAGTAGRRAIQLALAETTDDPDERVMLRVAAAGEADPGLAAELDAAAARAADRGDLQVAVDLARRAVELTPEADVGDRVERLLTAADLAAAGGDGFLPVELAEAAESLSDDIDVRFRAGVTKFLTIGNRGDHHAAVEIADRLLPQLDGHPAKRARLHDLRAQALLRNDVPTALAAAASAVDAATAAGDDDMVLREQSLWTMICVLAGEPVDLDAVERTANSLPDESIAKDWLADVLSFCDRSGASLAISVDQLAHYQRLGLVHYEAPVRSRMIGDLIELGRFAEAIRHADMWFDLQGMIGGVPSSTIHSDVAYVHALTGATDRARRELATAESDLPVPIDELSVCSRGCQLHAALEEWPAAVDRAERARDLAARIGYRGIGPAPFRADAIEALVHLRRLDDARELADELAEIAAHNREPRGAGDVARAEALLAAAAGDLPAAVELWRTAVEVFTAIELPLELGQAQVGLGSTLRRLGKRAEAAERLAEARQTFDTIGAPLFVTRVDAEFQRLGARRVPGSTELTPTERQVVELVVAGRSNADIAATLVVSVRTVESNLTRSYRKLGVKSRTELAAVYRRQPA